MLVLKVDNFEKFTAGGSAIVLLAASLQLIERKQVLARFVAYPIRRSV